MASFPVLKDHAGPWPLGGETGHKRDKAEAGRPSKSLMSKGDVGLNEADGNGGGRKW